MRYLSVCSGIEAASVAWHPLGWTPVAFSEIEKFPSAVLAHHYPGVPNWGDMTKFQEWPDACVCRELPRNNGGSHRYSNDGSGISAQSERGRDDSSQSTNGATCEQCGGTVIDLLVGGTPCQSFSVAGLRKGLADPRGNLALTYLAVLDKYRPEWCVWENVPGVLSSGGGRDFGAFLGGLGQLGYGFAYRMLDAQFFGVPQRRRRVFVVGCLGGWQRAAAVLFDQQSLLGHPAPRREAGQGTAPSLAKSLRGCSGGIDREDMHTLIPAIANPLTARMHKGINTTCDEGQPMIAHSLRADGFDASEDGTGRGTPLVPVGFYQNEGSHGSGDNTNIAPTLKGAKHSNFAAVAFDTTQITSAANYSNPKPGDPCHPLASGAHAPAVAFDARQSDVIQYGEKTGPLDTDGHTMAVLSDTLYNKGYGTPQETYASSLLRTLSKEVGAEAFTQWGLGILDSLQSQKVLRSEVHGRGVRLAANFSRSWLVYHALARPEAHSEGLMQAMREAECQGCASQGWRPSEQFARELGAYLSELSQPGAQEARFMLDLWQASEGIGLLRETLSAVQEVGRSSGREGQSTSGGMQVRRLTVEECEFLQGFPRNYTLIPYRGKPAADGPRYKALGNSMAVPCMSWLGRRIQQVQDISKKELA